MEKAKALLEEGNLNGAIDAALQAVKASPTNVAARTFLFELSLFSGDWDRADRQLDAIGHQDVNAMVGSLVYRHCLAVEKQREKTFKEGVAPEFITPPPPYVMESIYAINSIREGKLAEARDVLDKVDEERPAFTCKVNGEEVEDFRDCNDITSAVLEVIIKDNYIWVPIEQIVKLKILERKTLRDLYWLQGELETSNGTKGEVFIPALYSGSYRSQDDTIRLGRSADWRDLGNDILIGEGMKLFWLNGKATPIFEIREIEFEVAESAAGS
ncbi:MAG: type VI secretion system accessory protein TagJ [Acidobacteriota bacterium]